MHILSFPKTFITAAYLGILSVGTVRAADPTGEEILRNVQTATASVKDYTVTLDVAVNMERLKVPHMRALMYFKQPDKIHFDATGFAMLPREGVAFSASRILQYYTVEQVEHENLNGVDCYRLQLLAKSDRESVRRMTVLIDPAHWTPARISVVSPEGRSLVADFQHAAVGDVWLPSTLTVTFSQKDPDPQDAPDIPGRPMGRTGTPRQGTVKVTYTDYRVNTGLSDDIFAPEKNTR